MARSLGGAIGRWIGGSGGGGGRSRGWWEGFLQDDVLYLVAVNSPSDADIARARERG